MDIDRSYDYMFYQMNQSDDNRMLCIKRKKNIGNKKKKKNVDGKKNGTKFINFIIRSTCMVSLLVIAATWSVSRWK